MSAANLFATATQDSLGWPDAVAIVSIVLLIGWIAWLMLRNVKKD